MSIAALTIRNITPTHFTLKLVEQYKPLADVENGFGHSLSRNFTTRLSHSTQNALQYKTKSGGGNIGQTSVDIAIAPFKSCQTDIKVPHLGVVEGLRLTFNVDREKYTFELPSSTNSSKTFKSSSSAPKYEFTGIYLPAHTFLAVFSSAELHSWMKQLKDETPLSALSIPGTHNSPTCHKALPSVRCQAVGPQLQLENGVRFFDIRVQPEAADSPKLALVHGAFPISLTGPKHFRQLLDVVFSFLDHNPSETVIISLKREGTGTWAGEHLARILLDHYTGGGEAHRWYTKPDVPTLGEVRGKVVLMRRFGISDTMRAVYDGRGWGIDAENWADNTPHDTHGNVCVQDFYEVLETTNIEKKISYCEAHLERAASCIAHLPGITTDPIHPVPPQPFYLNFLSASNFWRSSCWPERIAARLNPVMRDWICRLHGKDSIGDGGTGIVVCDWVGTGGNWDLVRAIIGFNSMLMVREMSM